MISKCKALALCFVLISSAAFGQECAGQLSQAEQAAYAAAIQFLKLVDQGKYGDAWDSSRMRMKQEVKRDDFIKGMRPPFRSSGGGSVQSRFEVSSSHEDISGCPRRLLCCSSD